MRMTLLSAYVVSLTLIPIAAGGVEGGEPKQATTPFLRFKDQQNVEIEKSAGMLDLKQSFTIELWFRIGTESKRFMYLAGDEAWNGMNKDIAVDHACGWILRATDVEADGRRRIDFTIAIGGNHSNPWFSVITAPLPFANPKNWHHVAVCRTSQFLLIYVDGKLEGARPCERFVFHPSPTNLFLGPRKHGYHDRRLFGDIDAFRISSRVRYHKDFTPPEKLYSDTATLLNLEFASNKNQQLRDLTGQGRHGKIVGPVWAAESKQAKTAKQPSVEDLQQELHELRLRNAILKQKLEEAMPKSR